MRLGFKDFVWLIIFSAIIDWKEIKKIRRPIGRGFEATFPLARVRFSTFQLLSHNFPRELLYHSCELCYVPYI